MKKWKFAILGSIVVAIVIGVGVYRHFYMELIADPVVTELGEPLSTDVSEYVKGNITHAQMDMSSVYIEKTGLYEAHITNGTTELDMHVEVTDTTPPTATVLTGLKFLTNEEVNAAALVTDVKDTSNEVSIAFIDGKEIHTYIEGGKINETVVLTDASGNKSSLDVTFQVTADITKPIIRGVKSLKIFTGEKFDFAKGVTASDDQDGDLTAEIIIDTEKVDIKTPGTYSIIYSVIDRSGNETKKKARVTVEQDKSPVLKGVGDKTVYLNNKVDYLEGVSASDDRDGNLTSKIQVNNSQVNLTKPGEYKVIYTVIDNTSNKTTKTIIVTVKKKVSTSYGNGKTSTDKKSTKTEKDNNQSSSGGFKFFDVDPSGEMPNGDVPASGEHIGNWG